MNPRESVQLLEDPVWAGLDLQFVNVWRVWSRAFQCLRKRFGRVEEDWLWRVNPDNDTAGSLRRQVPCAQQSRGVVLTAARLESPQLRRGIRTAPVRTRPV